MMDEKYFEMLQFCLNQFVVKMRFNEKSLGLFIHFFEKKKLFV